MKRSLNLCKAESDSHGSEVEEPRAMETERTSLPNSQFLPERRDNLSAFNVALRDLTFSPIRGYRFSVTISYHLRKHVGRTIHSVNFRTASPRSVKTLKPR